MWTETVKMWYFGPLLTWITVGMVIFVLIIFALDSKQFNNECQMISNEVDCQVKYYGSPNESSHNRGMF